MSPAGARGRAEDAAMDESRGDAGPCPVCQDTGWVTAEAEPGGRPGLVRRCDCLAARRTRRLLAGANIPKRYRNCSLANFDPLNPSLKDALKISRKFVESYLVQDVGLLFIGPPGVGKTHLAVAMIRELILTRGVPCLFYDFRDLIRDIQATFTPDAPLSESDVLEPVFSSRVLVLDELGAKRSSAWVEETIFLIINQRYNARALTLFTSNFLDTEADEEDTRQPQFKKSGFGRPADDTLVDRIGYRLRSRIYEMCKVVPLEGGDFRKNVKQAKYRF